MTINLVALRYFHTVATSKNISRAAGRLNVAQSAVSRQLLLLEEDLGVQLLVRHHRGVALTEAGSLLMERAQSLLRMAGDLRRELTAVDGGEVTGKIRLGFPPSLSRLIAAPLAQSIADLHRSIDFHLFAGFTPEVKARLEEDNLDLGIVSLIDTNRQLELTPLFTEDLWLVGQSGPNWSFPEGPIEPSMLDGADLVLSSGLRQRLEAWQERSGCKARRIIETDAQDVMIPLLRAGLGHVVMPTSGLPDAAMCPDLRMGRLKGMHLTRYLAEVKARPRSAAMQIVVKHLAQQVRELSVREDKPVRAMLLSPDFSGDDAT